MDWLFENPLPELLICGVLAALFAIVATQKQRGVILLGAIAFVLLGVGAWLIDRGVQTDGEAVKQSLYDMVTAYQRKDEEATLQHISPQAGMLRMLVLRSMDVVTVRNDLHITDVSVEFSNENSIARSHFRVNATVELGGHGVSQHAATRWEATWQKTGEGWLMTDIIELDPITGTTTDRLESELGGG